VYHQYPRGEEPHFACGVGGGGTGGIRDAGGNSFKKGEHYCFPPKGGGNERVPSFFPRKGEGDWGEKRGEGCKISFGSTSLHSTTLKRRRRRSFFLTKAKKKKTDPDLFSRKRGEEWTTGKKKGRVFRPHSKGKEKKTRIITTFWGGKKRKKKTRGKKRGKKGCL